MTIFEDIKRAVSERHEEVFRELGLNVDKFTNGTWTSAKCPLCDDTGGSASVTSQGFLKCFQCGTKADLFDWLAQRDKCKPHEAAFNLARQLGIDTQGGVKTKRAGQMPARMTEEILEKAINDLWSSDAAKPCRKFLEDRKLDSDPEFLAELGIGFIKGYLIFAQRDHYGAIQDRFRGYLPGGSTKWQWFGRGAGGPAIWLAHREPRDRILLCEGEWDVLTALLRMRLEDYGWSVATWTAGAASSPALGDIPKSWKGKDVHICYDNDVFQGPDYNNYWTQDKRGEQKVRALLKNLLTKVAPTLQDAGCTVWIRQIPIDPKEILGGDLRDWYNRGGSSLNDLPLFKFSTLPQYGSPESCLEFDELWEGHLDEKVKVRTQVSMIGGDDFVVPSIMELKCQMGQLSVCMSCHGPRKFPDGIIPLDGYREQVCIGMQRDNLEDYLLKHVVKRPKACPEARLTTLEGKSASMWRGIRPDARDDTRQRTLPIISIQPPSLSGEVELTGKIYSNSGSICFFADQVQQLDRAEVDLNGIDFELRNLTPWQAEDTRQIDDYLDFRWRDISKHQTRVFGRRDVHVGCELLFHSVLGIPVGGKVRRGWLDVTLIGDTRTGKSMTIRGFIDWLRLGSIHSAVDNISRAGLIMGADSKGMLRPGLLPKSHRKLLCLDEFHWLVNSRILGQDHPMSWLQSARDEGRVYGVKIYGDRALPAKVRFLTISNWARSRRRTFTYACEHLAWMYGSPETLSRLDFGVVVEGPPSQFDFDEVEHRWQADYAKALILRAWAQDATQVILEPEAEQLAFEASDSWKHVYAYDKIPLYTPEEKPYSILRIATAVANICFSHHMRDPYSVIVRPVHVQWAIQWLKSMWDACEYDRFSRATITVNANDSPFGIERFLVAYLRLDDPQGAIRILAALMNGFTKDEIQMLGIQPQDQTLFLSKGLKMNALHPSGEESRNKFVLTDAAHDIALRLSELAMNDPDLFVDRYRRLMAWSNNDPQNLVPIHLMEA